MTSRLLSPLAALAGAFLLPLAAWADTSGDVPAVEAEPVATPVAMFDAIEQGDLEVKFIARSDHAARIIFANKTDRELRLTLPEAFAGVPVAAQGFGGGGGMGGMGGGGMGGMGGGQQAVGGGMGGMGGGGMGGGGMGGGGGMFSIPPEKTRKINVPVICLDHGKKDPSSSKPYKIVPVDSYVQKGEVVELLKAFGRGELQHGAAQAAVWAMNNDIPWQYLATKIRGSEHDAVRTPYFSRMEIQAGIAYEAEARRLAAINALDEPSPEYEAYRSPGEEDATEDAVEAKSVKVDSEAS